MISTLPSDRVVLVWSARDVDMAAVVPQVKLPAVVKSQISAVWLYPPVRRIFLVPINVLAAWSYRSWFKVGPAVQVELVSVVEL